MVPEDRPRFEALVAEVYEPLQRYLRRRCDRDTADDVLGDVLVVMWRRRADVPTDGALSWCYGVARRCLANQRRGSARQGRLARRLRLVRAPTEPADGDPQLAEALSGLSEADQDLLRLWAWEQLAPREIATVLDISANAASIRLHRAMAKLSKKMGGKEAGSVGHLADEQGEEVAR